MPAQQLARLLTKKDVAEHLGVSERAIERMVARGDFPKPVSVGVRLKRWPSDLIEQWVAERVQDASR